MLVARLPARSGWSVRHRRMSESSISMDITLPSVNWLSVLPILTLSLSGLLAVFWDAWMKEEDRPLLAWLSLTGIVATAFFFDAVFGLTISATTRADFHRCFYVALDRFFGGF